MSKAFDCIRRDRLLAVLNSFLDEDEIRLIRVLLANTSFCVRIGTATSESADTTIGTPQGDSLSPVLFVVYLEAALRDVRSTATARARPSSDLGLPFEIAYADDADFISTESGCLGDLEPVIGDVLDGWALKVNPDKTEITVLGRSLDRVAEQWRTTKKLGSLLGDSEDVSRRKQLAAAAFRSLWSLWSRRSTVGEELRLRLYNAFVLPVLVYNAGTWGLTAAAEGGLDAFHRGQLRSLIGFVWPQKIATTALYDRCKAEPISRIITRARWRLFGHILRLPSDAPAVLSMVSYFQCDDHKWRGRPRITLPVKLDDDLHRAACGQLQSLEDLERLSDVAAVRSEWRQLLDMICK
ncbi:uncharacterized protein LOC135820187 [Sycon ciliatum]|uniref:uncharacterized protein LOC135820187 n=1 Tax=Sycon ciliatum TaxID=27933 RepID=UPI0031F6C03A